MPDGLVDWLAYDGDILEEVYACLVLQDQPDGWRRRTDQGDGGVDVLLPEGEGWHVHQVKGSRELDKPKVQRSVDALLSDGRLPGPLVAWTLASPINPNRLDEDWFEGIKAQLAVPCHWAGSTRWNILRARYPEVVDTLLHGRKERVETRVKSVLDLAQATLGAPPSPADLIGPLEEVCRAATTGDPYFKYAFRVGPAAPDRDELLGRPGLVLGVVQGDGATSVTVEVFEKYLNSAADSGADIGGAFALSSLAVENAGTSLEQVHVDMGYGREISLTDAAERVTLRAPGGLGAEAERASIWIGPSVVSGAQEVLHSLTVEDGDGTDLATLEFRSTRATSAFLGMEFTSVSLDGTVSFRAAVPRDVAQQQATFSFAVAFEDPPVAVRLLKAIEFFSAAEPPNTLVWRLESGGELARVPIESSLNILEQPFVDLVADLVELQQHTPVPLRVPLEMRPSARKNVADGAALSRGEELGGQFERLPFVVDSDEENDRLLGTAGSAEIATSWSVDVFGLQVAVPGVTAEVTGVTRTEQYSDHVVVLSADPAGKLRLRRFERLGEVPLG
jgi:hypothetical protein